MAADPRPDSGFGRYENQGLLARDGAFALYRAFDPLLGRSAVVRATLPNAEPTAVEALDREAAITAQLQHPNVPPVLDAGRTDRGEAYFSMPLAHSVPLSELRRDGGGSDLRRRVGVLIPVCHALEFAHSRGVVHRRVGPGAIWLGEFGAVHLVGWGDASTERDGPVDPRPDLLGVVATLHRVGEPADRELGWILDRPVAPDAEDGARGLDALRRDLEAYLAHRPIAGRWYLPGQRLVRRLRRFRAAW